MVEVFKTNVPHIIAADKLSSELLTHIPNSRISFDLEDCDRILRIENTHVNSLLVVSTLHKRGFSCEVLE